MAQRRSRYLFFSLLAVASQFLFVNCDGGFKVLSGASGLVDLRSISSLNSATTGRVHVRVIQSSNEFFPPGQTPRVSWYRKNDALGSEIVWGSLAELGSAGPDQREFDVDLSPGLWYFGAQHVDGFGTVSYLLSNDTVYHDVPSGGIPVTVSVNQTIGILISYVHNSTPAFPSNQRLSTSFVTDYLPTTTSQQVIGSSAGVRVGVTADYGAIGTEIEFINPDHPDQRLQIVDPRSAGGAGWQATLGYSSLDSQYEYAPNQAAGNAAGTWGMAATLTDLRQTDWSPMWTDHINVTRASGNFTQVTSPAFDLGERHFDSQQVRVMDSLTTPSGRNVVRTTWTSRFRSVVNATWINWQSEQALYMSRAAALSGNLRMYFVGPNRSWASPELRPAHKGFFAEGDGHCLHQSYGVDGEYWNSSRSSCRVQSLAYLIYRYDVGGKDIAMAVVRDGGLPMSVEIDTARAVLCRTPAGDDYDPACGNLEMHLLLSFTDAQGQILDPSRQVSFGAGQIFENKVHYIVGSPQELADLGFTFAGGPQPNVTSTPPLTPTRTPAPTPGPTRQIPAGFVQRAGDPTIYYTNGTAYCAKQSWDDFVNSGGTLAGIVHYANFDGLRSDGLCAYVPQPEGFFQIPGDGRIYYSNGNDAFCAYAHWEDFVAAGGRADLSNVRQMSDPRLPPAMRNDGFCQ